MIPGVYIILNTVNGKRYVGSSINVQGRISDHKIRLSREVHGNSHLQRAWNKYGSNTLSFEIIEECSCNRLLEREQHFIDLYESMNQKHGYNQRGAERWGEVTDEVREKISVAAKGKHKSPEHCAKIGDANRRRVFSSETRAKMSASNRRRHHSAEVKAKIGAAQRGVSKSPEHVAKIVAFHTGRKRSVETREKISASRQGKPWSAARRAAYEAR